MQSCKLGSGKTRRKENAKEESTPMTAQTRSNKFSFFLRFNLLDFNLQN